ncbi:MAG: hypothetical protein AAF771_05715 [Pseudomonadota bacterium]
MSTWISRLFVACAALAVAACADGLNPVATRAAPEQLFVTGDKIVVAGPPGFCIDTGASNDAGESAFVLLASCASISRDPDSPRPERPGLLTVTVSAGSGVDYDGFEAELENYIRSTEGRALLSRTGDASSLEILETQIEEGAIYIHARDGSDLSRGRLEADYWRAFLGMGDRLVTASVTGFAATPLSREMGLFLLDSFANRLMLENESGAGG